MGASGKNVIVCQPGRAKGPFRLNVVLLPVGEAIRFSLYCWYCGGSVQSGDEDVGWISHVIFLAEVLENRHD